MNIYDLAIETSATHVDTGFAQTVMAKKVLQWCGGVKTLRVFRKDATKEMRSGLYEDVLRGTVHQMHPRRLAEISFDHSHPAGGPSNTYFDGEIFRQAVWNDVLPGNTMPTWQSCTINNWRSINLNMATASILCHFFDMVNQTKIISELPDWFYFLPEGEARDHVVPHSWEIAKKNNHDDDRYANYHSNVWRMRKENM